MSVEDDNPAMAELYAGYQAVAGATLDGSSGSAVSYEIAYLGGWADAMHHAGWGVEGKPVTGKGAFPMHAVRSVRKAARKHLKAARKAARGEEAS